MHTEVGKIGKALQVLQPEETNLQVQTGKIVRNFAIAGLLSILVSESVKTNLFQRLTRNETWR